MFVSSPHKQAVFKLCAYPTPSTSLSNTAITQKTGTKNFHE
jgi:hypothetical protein